MRRYLRGSHCSSQNYHDTYYACHDDVIYLTRRQDIFVFEAPVRLSQIHLFHHRFVCSSHQRYHGMNRRLFSAKKLRNDIKLHRNLRRSGCPLRKSKLFWLLLCNPTDIFLRRWRFHPLPSHECRVKHAWLFILCVIKFHIMKCDARCWPTSKEQAR